VRPELKIALLSYDSRELYRDYNRTDPEFGTAPVALMEGFAAMPELEVHVLSCAQGRMRSPEKLAANIYFHTLHVPKIGWLRTGYQGCIRAVRRKLKEIQPDIVHGQGTERDCALSAVFSGYPNVVTIHGNMAEIARLFHARVGTYAWVAGKLEGVALRRTAGVFCNSEYTERLVKPRARRVWRVPNAIREQFFGPRIESPGPRKCTVLNVGHPGPRKRQIELVAVMRELRRQGLDFEFQLIGDMNAKTAYTSTLRESIKPLEQEGVARCTGLLFGQDLVKTFDTASAMVHFPMEESFGLVVAEALARDLKLFGARLGGILDITSGVPDVELFGVDDWQGLASAVAGWMRSGFPRARGAAQVMRDRYGPQVVARRHVEIYREVLGRG
jgi:glycosyltransferase involved in cell wall biosynthesis